MFCFFTGKKKKIPCLFVFLVILVLIFLLKKLLVTECGYLNHFRACLNWPNYLHYSLFNSSLHLLFFFLFKKKGLRIIAHNELNVLQELCNYVLKHVYRRWYMVCQYHHFIIFFIWEPTFTVAHLWLSHSYKFNTWNQFQTFYLLYLSWICQETV